MPEQDDDWPVKAYKNIVFLKRREARTMRLLSEYLEADMEQPRHRQTSNHFLELPPAVRYQWRSVH